MDGEEQKGTQKEPETQPEEPKITYRIEEQELKKIEVEKNIFLRVIRYQNKRFIDIRKFYKGYPTKRGVRIPNESFKVIMKFIKDEI